MIAISTILICDGGCGETFGVDNQWRNGYAQRKEAKEQEGWKFIKGKDYCPKCVKMCGYAQLGNAKSELIKIHE